MSRSVAQMIDDVIRREVSYIDHLRDRGGPTDFGITQATVSRHPGRPTIVADVRRLSRAIAADIHPREYYESPRIDRPPERIRAFVFDAAARFLSRAGRARSRTARLPERLGRPHCRVRPPAGQAGGRTIIVRAHGNSAA